MSVSICHKDVAFLTLPITGHRVLVVSSLIYHYLVRSMSASVFAQVDCRVGISSQEQAIGLWLVLCFVSLIMMYSLANVIVIIMCLRHRFLALVSSEHYAIGIWQMQTVL